jgi:protein-S-isoprenylcysteine O-methyltransferase Ste14
MNHTDHGIRPLWVRVAARKETTRRAVWHQILSMALVAVAGLSIVAIEAGGTSLLGAVMLPFGLVLAGLAAFMTLLSWLALRWVDRNDKWAEAGDPNAPAFDENRDVGGEG